MSTLTWHGADVLRAVEVGMLEGLRDGGELIVAEAQHLLDKPYPPASRRGQIPRKRSGALQRSQNAFVEQVESDFYLHVGVEPSAEAGDYAAIVHRDRPWVPTAIANARALVVDAVEASLRRRLR